MAVARCGDGGWRTVSDIAVRHTITVVHGTDKCAGAFLPASALALRRAGDAVAELRRRSRAFLEEFLLLSALVLVGRPVLRRMRGMRWMRRLRQRRFLRLRLRLWSLHTSLLAGLVLAAAATAPMPMRLRLTVVRRRPLFRLGLRRFCCHNAYASWDFAFRCIELRVLLLVEPFHDRAQMLSGFPGM